jgi:carotenoid cleavage dioxygenase-like enzyme
MKVTEVSRVNSLLPADDDHPYRTGAWRPQFVEYDADDLDVIEGRIPADLDGVYLRNTENPVMPALNGRYHPFDGDGMVHAIRFAGGKARYRNRFVRTAGLAAELEAGEPLWAGITEPAAASKRDGWGARTRMKDASSTDVIVHNGRAITTFYQCGDAYAMHPETLEQFGPAAFGGAGISAHPKLDPTTGELITFRYSTTAPYLWYSLVDRDGRIVHETPVPLPGPRLPHDIAFTEHYVILNDLPLFWDEALLAKGLHRARYRPDLPTRFAVVPRCGLAPGEQVRWFEAQPTYVLHWINAFEQGNEIVLDGYFQEVPMPKLDPTEGPYGPLKKLVDVHALKARPHRWRLDLATGACREERMFESISEFPSIHYAKPGRPYRYAWSMTSPPGWFVFDGLVRLDLETGTEQRFQYDAGVYASESPMVPRAGATAEDDGYLVTFVGDVQRDVGECHLFDARNIADGPIARIALPARMSSGTHATWAPASALR